MEAVRSLLDAFEVNDAKKMKSSLQSLNVQVSAVDLSEGLKCTYLLTRIFR
jgi:hypothetical protein